MIDAKRVMDFNEYVCEESGQSSRLINEPNLLSALSVQQWFEESEVRAAALFRSLIIGHPFQDGDKRTAVLVLVSISKPDVSIFELERITLEVAKGNLTDPEYIADLLYRR